MSWCEPCCQLDKSICKMKYGPGSVCHKGMCYMAYIHPVNPIPDMQGQCSVEFGYKTAKIDGLCYVLGKPIAPSTWYGGTLENPVPIVAPSVNGFCSYTK